MHWPCSVALCLLGIACAHESPSAKGEPFEAKPAQIAASPSDRLIIELKGVTIFNASVSEHDIVGGSKYQLGRYPGVLRGWTRKGAIEFQWTDDEVAFPTARRIVKLYLSDGPDGLIVRGGKTSWVLSSTAMRGTSERCTLEAPFDGTGYRGAIHCPDATIPVAIQIPRVLLQHRGELVAVLVAAGVIGP
jgi:hypothetical protein